MHGRWPIARPVTVALLALAVAAAGSALLGSPAAWAQGGIEAAAQAAKAADWAERQKESDANPSDRFRVVSPTRRAQPQEVEAGPPRVPRKPSGAPGRVTGRVIEKGTGLPVPGVMLGITSTEPEYVIETRVARTDSTGAYEFTEIEPGRWHLAVTADRVPRTYAAPRAGRTVTVARRDTLTLPPFELSRTACVEGHAVWADGYVFSDAPVLVAPRDTTLFAAENRVNGLGEFEVCSAPADSAMVWLVLRDGRRLGRSAHLAVGQTRRVDFKPEPLDQMEGATVWIRAQTPDGRAVGLAQVLVVGRWFEHGRRPALVYSREATADRAGEAQFHLPYGVYEILAMNPREGQWGRVEQFVIAKGAPAEVNHDVILRGASTAAQRAAWRAELLDRAEVFLYLWAQ